ncbi:MAG: hypothetical protein R3B81_06900 [bacterium]
MRKRIIAGALTLALVPVASGPGASDQSSAGSLETLVGGRRPGVCMAYGTVLGLGFVFANPWAVGGALVGGYANGCWG